MTATLWAEMLIRPLADTEPIPYGLLLDADPSKELVDLYLAQSEAYVVEYRNAVIGIYLLCPVGPESMEIKNIAVAVGFQAKGIGQWMLYDAMEKAKQRACNEILIGTSSTSIGPLYLYQKVGFEVSHIIHNFFLEHYSEPLFDHGLHCKHMIVLKKVI